MSANHTDHLRQLISHLSLDGVRERDFSNPTECLCAIMEHAVRKLLAELDEPSRPALFIDCLGNLLIRDGIHRKRLPQNLAVALLEALLRGPVSATDFAMLRRFKQIRGYRTDRQLFNAFRRQLTALRQLILNFDLPITVKGDKDCLQIKLDSNRLGTNILVAQKLVDEAAARLEASDFLGAIQFAEKALQNDWDCSAAAKLVVQLVSQNPSSLNWQVATRAHFCLARSILVQEAAFQRLQGRYDPYLLQARVKAEQSLNLLQESFDTISCWSSRHPGEDDAKPVRSILQMWVNTARNRLIGHCDFTSHPFTKHLASQLLQKRQKKRSSFAKRKETPEELTPEIADKLYMSAWRPTPAMSLPEFERQLLTFLGRRVWRDLSGVGSGSDSPVQQLSADGFDAMAQDNVSTAAGWMDINNILRKKITDETKRQAFRQYLEDCVHDRHCWPKIAQQYGFSDSESAGLLKQLQDLLASMPEVQKILSRQRSRRSPRNQ
jgi:hypothetical protein